MVEKLRLILTDGIYYFRTFEFGRDIPFKIYDETDTAFNYTGYTVVIRFLDDSLVQELNDIIPLTTTPSSGTGTFEFSSTNRPEIAGYHFFEANLTKSGEELVALSPRSLVSDSPD